MWNHTADCRGAQQLPGQCGPQAGMQTPSFPDSLTGHIGKQPVWVPTAPLSIPRTLPPCSCVQTSWTKRTSSGSQTLSLCSTGAMRTARESPHTVLRLETWPKLMSAESWESLQVVASVPLPGILQFPVSLQVHHLPQDRGCEKHTEPSMAALQHPCAGTVQWRL